ncbi:transketolase [Candidatus Aerophobetes bacterium]|nr:transketolase [Candidatus Aerophobetes bacterium]
MVQDAELVKRLKKMAAFIRRDSIQMSLKAGCGHVGPGLSWTDICTVLFFHQLRIDPKNPDWLNRDRFILSKGHGCLPLYSALARKGFFPMEKLDTFCQLDSCLGGHPDCLAVPGVEISTGSLGHGLPIAIGMAIAAKSDNKKYRVITVMGDGELQEGTVWEAAMAAAHYRLDNLTGIIDCNKLEIDGPVKEVMNIEPLKDKWKSFGWYVEEMDGNDIEDILSTLERVFGYKEEKPRIIIAHTIKGKGVSFMENQVVWHYKAPDNDEARQAIREIDLALTKLK